MNNSTDSKIIQKNNEDKKENTECDKCPGIVKINGEWKCVGDGYKHDCEFTVEGRGYSSFPVRRDTYVCIQCLEYKKANYFYCSDGSCENCGYCTNKVYYENE
jgi:hypothetical protein